MSTLHPDFLNPPVQAALKDLHLVTRLVCEGRPAVGIVVPADGRYARHAGAIQAAIAEQTGVRVPVVSDCDAGARVPMDGHLIVLGNRSTNRTIEELYNRFYTLLDRRFPGPGGYEVRSLHNPFGNGCNVLFVGGSDGRGVARAVRAFCGMLAAAPGGAGELAVGWLLEVRLGRGLVVPEDLRQVEVWEASPSYGSRGYFGWNSISKRMALYYMTGNEFQAREAVRLAFPDEQAKREIAELDGELIENKDEPLSGPYHYGAVMMILFWDLIEESPVFSDAERLRITNAFAKHLAHLQERGWREEVYARYGKGPEAIREPPQRLGDRHELWSHVGLFCLARYFQTHYPAPVWRHCLDGVYWYFSVLERHWWVHGLFESPGWYSSSLAPILTYMLLSGDRRALASGALAQLLRGQEVLCTGAVPDPILGSAALDFLDKAAYLTQDGRYLEYRRRLGLDLAVFRLGQSYWPESHLRPRRPVDRLGCWTVLRMPEVMWRARDPGVPLSEAFIFGSFRSALDATGDYVFIETYKGLWWDLYHTFKISQLRLGGQTVLAGTLNQVLVRFSGLLSPRLSLDCGVRTWSALGRTALVEAVVPHASHCEWQRGLLLRQGRFAVVSDSLRFRADSDDAEIEFLWQGPAAWEVPPGGGGLRQSEGAVRYSLQVCDQLETQATAGGLASMAWRGAVRAGQTLRFVTLIAPAAASPECVRLAENAAALALPEPVLFVTGRFADVSGETVLVSGDHLYAHGLACVDLGGVLLAADAPATVDWDLAGGVLEADLAQSTGLVCRVRSAKRILLDGRPLSTEDAGEGRVRLRVPAGRHVLRGLRPPPPAAERLRAALAERLGQGLERQRGESSARPRARPTPLPAVEPAFTADMPAPVTCLVPIPRADGPLVGAAAGTRISLWQVGGGDRTDLAADAPVQALHWWPEPGLLLAGCKDGKVIAFDVDRGTRRWVFQSEMDPAVWRAAKPYWFSSAKGHEGVHGLHTGVFLGGRSQAFAGSACTLEVLDEEGSLVRRLPVFWGPGKVFALVPQPDGSIHLLVGREPADTHAVVVISNRAEYVPNMLGPDPCSFHDTPPGHTDVWVWGAMYRNHLFVADIDGDGQVEVVSDITGAWNRVTVWSAAAKPLHNAHFGPGPAGRVTLGPRAMRDMDLADLEGSGRLSVVAAAASGWLVALDCRCQPVWARRLATPATVLKALGVAGAGLFRFPAGVLPAGSTAGPAPAGQGPVFAGPKPGGPPAPDGDGSPGGSWDGPVAGAPRLVIGCEGGTVLWLDRHGVPIGEGRVHGTPTAVAALAQDVVLATDGGQVRGFRPS